jgi:hypothetical protein
MQTIGSPKATDRAASRGGVEGTPHGGIAASVSCRTGPQASAAKLSAEQLIGVPRHLRRLIPSTWAIVVSPGGAWERRRSYGGRRPAR